MATSEGELRELNELLIIRSWVPRYGNLWTEPFSDYSYDYLPLIGIRDWRPRQNVAGRFIALSFSS